MVVVAVETRRPRESAVDRRHGRLGRGGGWNDLGSRQSSAVSRQPSAISRQYSWAQKKMFAWQEQWGLTHNDGVTVASRALQSIVWSLGVRPERVMYVPNGVVRSGIGRMLRI